MKRLHELNINFMGRRLLATGISAAVVVLSIGALAVNGLNLGLDFTGGTQVEVRYSEPADLTQVRAVLNQQGLRDAVAVHFGSNTEVLIRFQGSLEEVAIQRLDERLENLGSGAEPARVIERQRLSGEYQTKLVVSATDVAAAKDELFPPDVFGSVQVRPEGDAGTAFFLEDSLINIAESVLINALSEAAGSRVTLVRNEFVGTQVGAEMYDNAVIGALAALAVVMLYVAIRFQFKFAVGAVVALAHDVLIVLGWFALFQIDFDLTVFAAVLAVIGYSLNDTIVIADRIRENLRGIRKKEPIEVINISLNQTLGRTIVTGLTTLLVLFALFFFGGELIHGFSLALIIGIIVGTYSSIYVAANILVAMKISREDLLVPVKEGAELDNSP